MPREQTMVIVGGGLAGAKAAQGARSSGFEGRILLIGDEMHSPYERPPLSKAVLRGEADPASARVNDDAFYKDNRIEVVVGTVRAIDARRRRVELGGDDGLEFDSAILATGANARHLTIPGADLDGVHYLRTVDDSVRLRNAIRKGGRVAVIGGGWIGTEVAASARQMGADVVVFDPGPTLLHRQLGTTLGDVFRRLHTDNGVAIRSNTRVTELRGATRVEQLVLDDGSSEPADIVVAGIGAEIQLDVARSAGVDIDNGVLVDEHLQTSVPGIYAAGDIANAWHPSYKHRIRVEHWANALNQGLTAGRNAAGADKTYKRLPYFYTDQYDLGMEYVGLAEGTDAVTFRGDVDKREFIAFWQRDGRVTAAMNVNVWDVVEDLKSIVSGKKNIDPTRLADGDIPLSALAA